MPIAEQLKYLKFTTLADTVFWDYYSLHNKANINSKFPLIKLEKLLKQRKGFITIDDEQVYKLCRVQIQGKGVVLRDKIIGKSIKTKKQQLCKRDDFLVAEIDAKVGGFGIVPPELEDAIVSGHYFLFEIDKTILLPEYLGMVVKLPDFLKQVKSTGSTNYAAIRPYHVLEYQIPLPSVKDQKKLVDKYKEKIVLAEELQQQSVDLDNEIEDYLFKELGLAKNDKKRQTNISLQIINFETILEWGLDKILVKSNKKSTMFPITSIEESPEIAIALFRGKSPKYKNGTNSYILNQKCNRWNKIDLSFTKTVDETWLNSIQKKSLTKEGDVLINSTGEGTIGRATYIQKEFEGLLYDSHLLLLRLDRKRINPELFVEIFNSEYGQKQVNDIKSAQATKQTELGISNLSKIQFPLPDKLHFQNLLIEKIKKMRAQKFESLTRSTRLKFEAEQDFEKTIFSYEITAIKN